MGVTLEVPRSEKVGWFLEQLYPQTVSKLILIEPPILMESWIIESVEEHIVHLEKEMINYAEQLLDKVTTGLTENDRKRAIDAFISHPNITFCTQEKLKHHFSRLKVARVVGSGPWATFEVLDQINAMIDRFLELDF